MTRTVSVSLGGRNFIIEEGAYYCLKAYFDKFKNDLLEREGSAASAGEVMEEVEMRVADLLREYLSNREVVDEALVKEVIRQVGTPDGQPFTYTSDKDTAGPGSQCAPNPKPAHKLFRDTDNATLGGVCSGLAAYFDVDVVVMRVLFVAAAILGLAGLWIYLICWIVVPKAVTATDKCAMRGIEPTAENILKYTRK